MRKTALAAAALLLAQQPALAQPIADPYAQAVAARIAGDAQRAEALLRPLIVTDPANSDAQLQLGLALLAQDRLDEAEAAFRRALQLAPDYADARIGLARIAQRRGDGDAALAALDGVDPANAEARALRAALGGSAPGAEPRVRLDFDLSFSDLDEPSQDWQEASLRARYQASQRTAVGAALELSDRFGRTDVHGELRIDRSLREGSGVHLLGGATPDADFRPRWQLGAGGFIRVAAGANPTVLTLDGRQARYDSGSIQTLTPGLEQYLLGGRAWLTARWINIFDEQGDHHSGWLGRGDLMASDRMRLFAGLADAPDTSAGIVIDTFSLFGGVSYDLTDRHAIRLSLAHEDRESGSDRLEFGIGVGTRF